MVKSESRTSPTVAVLSIGLMFAPGCGADPVAPSHEDRENAVTTTSLAVESDSGKTTVRRAREPVITAWESVVDLPDDIAIFDTVFWEPDDTRSLRQLIRTTDLVRGKRVLEIGTGSGLVSLCCLQAGAASVVATDINPNAAWNAKFNAERLGLLDRFAIRVVPRRSPEAWAVVDDGERFDLVISNPPWEDQKPTTVADFALYDPGFQLLDSLLTGLNDRLTPGGRALLAYGCVTAVRRAHSLAEQHGLSVRILDDRDLDELPEVFLPGMLIEVTVRDAGTPASADDLSRSAEPD